MNQRYCKSGGFCIPLKASSSLCYRSIPDKVDRTLYFLYIFPIFLGIKRLAPSRDHFILRKCQNVKVLYKDIIFLNCSLMFGHCKVEEKDASLGTHKYMCMSFLLPKSFLVVFPGSLQFLTNELISQFSDNTLALKVWIFLEKYLLHC